MPSEPGGQLVCLDLQLSKRTLHVYNVNDAIDSAAHLAGIRIRVTGLPCLGVEVQALMHMPESKWRRTGPVPWRSAIWLNFERYTPLEGDFTSLVGRQVIVTGQIVGFDPPGQDFGHLGMYCSEFAVEQIAELMPMQP